MASTWDSEEGEFEVDGERVDPFMINPYMMQMGVEETEDQESMVWHEIIPVLGRMNLEE